MEIVFALMIAFQVILGLGFIFSKDGKDSNIDMDYLEDW